MTSIPELELNNGTKIPQLGLGTYKIQGEDARKTLLEAIDAGYRHLDTAEMYENEDVVGTAVRESGIDRSEFFVTSKLNNPFQSYDEAMGAFDKTLKDLDIEYVDLFLIHWPQPATNSISERWRALEEIYRRGDAKAIGVSNFHPAHLEEILASNGTVPAVNQFEIHPFLVQDELRSYCKDKGIATVAYSPIARGQVFEAPVIQSIAERIERTPAQVVLRWHIQRGEVVIPKSSNRARMEENLAIFDFELSSDDMAAITSLDKGYRTGANPEEFSYMKR